MRRADASGDRRPWWDKAVHGDRRESLRARGRVKAALRSHFEAEGFAEVECAILQHSPGNEAHLHAFATEALAPDGRRETLYLHTSPEFAAKKLLAAGEERIFEFARVFRNREAGALHAREFTMLEWYRANAPYERTVDDCLAILARAAKAANATALTFRGRSADPFAAPERLTVAEAFHRFAGVGLLATIGSTGEANRDALAAAAAAAGIRFAPDDDWSDIFSRILVEKVEPRLGLGRITVLGDYPVVEAALARPKAGDPRVAERFEIYAAGVELANGFGELTDPRIQRARFEAEMALKERRYGERYPLDESFLDALGAMPEASGVALGFDRLVMLLLGAPRIADVLWTPAESGG
ncbi:MAG: EF-P lysine aminoacylase GenX [Alphaproteobacteria bacterium]|nr:EF-P lysine aminoacylase GenX [Alphaproteobacteria bacterium]